MLSQPDFSEALNEEEMEEIKVTTIVPSRAAMNRTTHRLAMITANFGPRGYCSGSGGSTSLLSAPAWGEALSVVELGMAP